MVRFDSAILCWKSPQLETENLEAHEKCCIFALLKRITDSGSWEREADDCSGSIFFTLHSSLLPQQAGCRPPDVAGRKWIYLARVQRSGAGGSRARPEGTLCYAKNPHEGETSRGRNEVELEGVEPSSKQGNHTLSTRLSWTSFSCCSKTQATNCNLIL